MKKLIALLMLACMLLCLCACGENADQPTEQNQQENITPNESGTAPIETDPSDGKTEYTAYVKDSDGNPIAGVMIQICKDTCMPAVTDEAGKAVWRVEETDGYKVSFSSGVPEGYAYVDEAVTEFYFEGDSKEITVIINAIPAIPEGKAEYVAYVVDEGGNPVANVMIQICKDTCMPAITDENGKVVWQTEETDGYKVSFPAGAPAGYAYVDEAVTEFYFEGDSKEITVTLKAIV